MSVASCEYSRLATSTSVSNCYLCGNFALKPLQIGEIMSNNKIMQFSYFYWNKNEKKGDEKKTLFRYCVMLLEKCIMEYYSLVVWFALKTEISKYSIFSQEKPFGETFSKITIKVSKVFFFCEETAKKWNAAPRHIVAGLKPLNFTIFKALGKKGGWTKQVHLWQVSKASQLKCHLVQDNAFFTRLKIARRVLSSALS